MFSRISQRCVAPFLVQLAEKSTLWEANRLAAGFHTSTYKLSLPLPVKPVESTTVAAKTISKKSSGPTSDEKKKADELWKSLFQDPSKWNDYRHVPSKRYFLQVKGSEALICSKAPGWVKEKLRNMPQKSFANDILWQSIVDNPKDWMDMRPAKKSLSSPDFMSKHGKGGLWIESAPEWAVKELQALKVPVSKEALWASLLENPGCWIDMRTKKKSEKAPDFVNQKDIGLWLDSASKLVVEKLSKMDGSQFAKDSVPTLKDLDSWTSLLQNPERWTDLRSSLKKGEKGPDFVSKEGKALRLENAPKSILEQITAIEPQQFNSKWHRFLHSPREWLDMRSSKKNPKAPDFTKKSNRDEALWLEGAPSWAVEELATIPKESFANEEPWHSLLKHPENWYDWRSKKTKETIPDFSRRDGTEALWLNSAPVWVPGCLSEKSLAFA